MISPTHLTIHDTLSRTPLDERSARRTWHTPLSRDKHPLSHRYSNPQSYQANDRIPTPYTARPLYRHSYPQFLINNIISVCNLFFEKHDFKLARYVTLILAVSLQREWSSLKLYIHFNLIISFWEHSLPRQIKLNVIGICFYLVHLTTVVHAISLLQMQWSWVLLEWIFYFFEFSEILYSPL